MLLFIFSGQIGEANSTGRMISLNPAESILKTILVAKSSQVLLSNDSQLTLYDFTIINVASGKRTLSIEDLKPNASFNIAFNHTGTYIACYSEKRSEATNKSTCLQIDVVGLRSV